jgi:hypothetical protein
MDVPPLDQLLAEIEAFIRERREDPARRDDLALQLARIHALRDPWTRRLCSLRGVDPAKVERVVDWPAVPTEAFKRRDLHVMPARVVRRFSTSGTSGGEAARGTACYSEHDLRLMDAAIDVNAARCLFPDHGTLRTRILILAPSPAAAPAMIMAYGMERLRVRYGAPRSEFLIGPKGLDVPRLLTLIEEAILEDEPVTLIGASFGFVNLLDGLGAKGLRFGLPEGSRVMDAGGFKGQSREVTREELVSRLGDTFGVPPEMCVNLLGLTEHASQFYGDEVAASLAGRPARVGKQNPPWTRTWAVAPETLAPLPHGEVGLLRYLDLANGGHPILVQTDDLGVTGPEGFEVLGRAGAAEARGCSLSVDELTRGEGAG